MEPISFSLCPECSCEGWLVRSFDSVLSAAGARTEAIFTARWGFHAAELTDGLSF